MRTFCEFILVLAAGFLIPTGCFAFFRLTAWLSGRKGRRL